MISRRRAVFALGAGVLAAPLASFAQTPGKVYRIGYLQTTTRDQQLHLVKALVDGLRDLGYVEGRNLVIEYRFADGKPERIPQLAEDLVKLKVDVIVTGLNPTTVAAKQATKTTPIVMAISLDPVGSGLITSLARPGGNVTGLTFDVGAEIWGKRFELLREFVPKLSRMAVLMGPAYPPGEAIFNSMETPARILGITLFRFDVQGPADLQGAFNGMTRARSDALMTIADPRLFGMRSQIAQLAVTHRLPSVTEIVELTEAGCLISYGASLSDQWRCAATYVDKILKGAKPGDLPVEQPTKFELVINAKTAKALGIKIPQSVLLRADRVIE